MMCVARKSKLLVLRNPEYGDLLLLEVPPVFLVDQNQIKIVARAKLLVDVAEGRCQFKASEEESDGDRFTANGSTVHDLEFGDGLGFVVLVRSCTCCLAANNGKFHVLDLDADEEEVDLSDDDVFEVVSALEKGRVRSE